MPILSTMEFPKPNDWQEFEKMCLSALTIKWGIGSGLTLHGRQGQKQNGVDILGHDDLGRFVGIQCKQTLNTISQTIIDNEIKQAENFQPIISTLYIVTTASTDAELQKYVRLCSEERYNKSLFTVKILFWSDIFEYLSKDKSELLKYYPDFPFQDEKYQNKLLNKTDYLALSREYNLPCRCPLLLKCQRRLQTLELINRCFEDEVSFDIKMEDPFVPIIGEYPYLIGGGTSFMIDKLCPEVSLFDAPITIMKVLKAPLINAEYDKYIEQKYKIIETGHFSECAEYVSSVYKIVKNDI
jgi:hypothetical protein